MAEREIYRLDIKIGVAGDDETKKKLTATERFAKQSEKKLKALDKIKASPSVRLNDKASSPLEKINSKLKRVDKAKVSTTVKLEDKATTPISKIENKTEKLNKSKTTPTVKINDEATPKLNKIESKLQKVSKFTLGKIAALVTAGAVAIGGLGLGSTMKTYVDFEQGLANVKAVSNATAAEMQLLSKEAKQLGAETAWSAKQVTDAEMLLSQAGFTVPETIVALPGLLDMASAGEIDLAQATDIAAGTLRAFGIEASKTTQVADVLAYTAAATNSDITGLGESLKYVAPVSKALGISLEETTSALGMLANANIKGSQAGTVLRAAFSRLANPSKEASKTMKKLGLSVFDTRGKMLPLDQVIGNLRKSTYKLTEQQRAAAISTIFGMEAMSGMLALVDQGPDALKKLTKELDNADGSAKKMSDTRLDSLMGQITILKSAAEGMKIELGERLAPYAKEFVTWLISKMPDITNKTVEIVDKISNLATEFNNLSPSTKKLILGATLGIVSLGPLVKIIGGITGGVGGLISSGPKLAAFFGLFSGAKAIKEASKTVEAVSKVVEVSAQASKTVPIFGAGGQILKTVTQGTTVAAKEVAKSTATAASGVNAVGTAAKVGTSLLNPWIIGLGLATVSAVGLYKHLNKEVIPTVDLFSDKIAYGSKEVVNSLGEVSYEMTKTTTKISKGTKEAISAYMEMDRKIGDRLTSLYVNSSKITGEIKDELVNSYIDAGKEIRIGIDKDYSERLTLMQDLLSKSKSISKEEQQAVLSNMAKGNQAKKTEIDNYVNTAARILQESSKNGGEITSEQQQQLNSALQGMREKAVTHLSETEMESKIILERLKAFSDRLTAEQASNIIQEAEKARIKTVDEANRKYLETKTIIEAEKDELEKNQPGITKILLDEAEKRRKESVEKAEAMKTEVVKQIELMNEDISKKIDTGDGHIKEKHERLTEWLKARPINKIVRTIQEIEYGGGNELNENKVDGITGAGYAAGTNFATKGLHEVAERGFEIVIGRQYRLFNGGEKVLNHKESKNFLAFGETNKTESKPKFTIAKPNLSLANGGNSTNVNVQNDFKFNNEANVDEIVEEAMEEFGYKLREALKNIKK